MMRICTLLYVVASILIPILCGLSTAKATNVKVVLEHVERVSRHEFHIALKVTNQSGSPIFLTGINVQKPIPDPLFLEQWTANQGWKTVSPCMDTMPPHVIKLNSGAAINFELVLRVPLPTICKERNLQLEGKFQYRLYYFDSAKQARTYLKKLDSGGNYKPEHSEFAMSEPFEIQQHRNWQP